MSSAVSARPPGGQHQGPELSSAKDQQKAGALGLTSATGLVIGTVIGAGVFTMPAVLAGAGTVSLAARRRPVHGWLLARDLSISVAAALFSLWVAFAAGYSAVYQAMVIVLAGIILYAFIRARRENLGQIPAPTDLAAAVPSGENTEGQS